MKTKQVKFDLIPVETMFIHKGQAFMKLTDKSAYSMAYGYREKINKQADCLIPE